MISPNLAYLVARKKERKKDGSDVVTCMKYGIVSFSTWSESICNLDTDIMRITGTSMTTASFRRWTPWMGTDKPTDTSLPQGQASRFPQGWLKCLLHPETPTMIGWIIYDRQWKSSAKRLPIRVLFRPWWLNLGVPMEYGSRPWVWTTLLVLTNKHFNTLFIVIYSHLGYNAWLNKHI